VRFGLVHRMMTNALAALGVLALVSSGQFNRWVSAIVLIGLVAALSRSSESWQRHPRSVTSTRSRSSCVVAIQVTRFLFDANVLDVLVEFAAGAPDHPPRDAQGRRARPAGHRPRAAPPHRRHRARRRPRLRPVLPRRARRRARGAGPLAPPPRGRGQLPTGRARSHGPARRRAAHPPVAPRRRSHVPRRHDACLSIPIFLFTALLFVIFPRVGLSLLLVFSRGHAGRMIGFSDRVDLGEVGVLRSDPTLAMRIEIPNLPDPPPPRLTLHLRGTALDATTAAPGRRARPEAPTAETEFGLIPIERCRPSTDEDDAIDLEPIDPPVLFLPPERGPACASAPEPARPRLHEPPSLRGPEGEFRYQPPDERGLKYEVFLSKPRPRRPSAPPRHRARTRYLALPADLPERIVDLAQEWTPARRRRWTRRGRSSAACAGRATLRPRPLPPARQAARSTISSSSRSAATASSTPPRWPSCSAPWASPRAT
jgi:hypothetical protein